MWEERTLGTRLSKRKKLVGTSLGEWRPTLNASPIPPRQRVLSPKEREQLRSQTSAWLEQGVVEKVEHLPWVNNTVHVAKSSGAIRVCIDCTPANKVTEEFDWPLPRLQDLRHHLAGAKWFSRMDLKDAFFRISVPTEWRHLTAFSCDDTCYQFRRMPFGLKTAPSVFQRFMDHALQKCRGIAFWYIDDVLVWGETLRELRANQSRVRAALQQAKCQINETKSEYEKEGLLFAGVWVYGRGVGPNTAKVKQVESLPPPRTKVEKQSALGLASYLRDHIPLASHFTAELSTSKDNTISEEEYASLWRQFTKHVAKTITTLGDWNEEGDASLYTDASNKGCAAVLIQDGRIIALASRKLSPAETRYSATDREHLGLLLAARKFRVFLHRSSGNTRVLSDHAALLTRKTNDMTPRQSRWHTYVSQWIPNTLHVKGKDNPADFFSRWGLEVSGGQISSINK